MSRLKKKKHMIGVLAVSLSAALLLTSCGAESSQAVISGNQDLVQAKDVQIVFDETKSKTAGSKEETVSVKTDASGNPLEVTSSVILSDIGDGEFVMDSSNLENIRNTEGDEEYEQKGTQLLWENKGEDITYEGDASKQPDLGVEVTYYLDGNKLTPEEIAGKSGDVRICFHYKNNVTDTVETNGMTKEMKVPYMFLTVAVLDEAHFSNVEVKNGSISKMSDMLLATGIAVPGMKQELGLSALEAAKDINLPEYVEITAQANDFQLDFTTTIASSGIYKDLNTEKLKDGEDLISNMKELRSASFEILKGISSIGEGSAEFGKALKTYTDGAAELEKGSSKLAEGANVLSGSGEELKNGAGQLASRLAELNNVIQNMDGTDSTDLEETFAGIEQAIAGLEEKMTLIKQAHPAPAEGTEPSEEEKQVQQAISEAEVYIQMLRNIIEPIKAGIQSADGQQLETLKEVVQALSDGANGLNDGINKYVEGTGQLASGANELQSGANAFSSGGAELYKGYGALTEGINQLYEGYAAFDGEGIAELSNLAGSDLQNIFDQIRTLKIIDNKSRSFSGSPEGTKASVQYIFETEKVEKTDN